MDCTNAPEVLRGGDAGTGLGTTAWRSLPRAPVEGVLLWGSRAGLALRSRVGLALLGLVLQAALLRRGSSAWLVLQCRELPEAVFLRGSSAGLKLRRATR